MFSATLNTRDNHSVVPGRAGGETTILYVAQCLPCSLTHLEVIAILSLRLRRIEQCRDGFGLSWVASNIQNVAGSIISVYRGVALV